MTIEEMIHFATCLKNNWTIDFNDMEVFCNLVAEALEELKWYREQDLIQREEVPVMRLCMAINTNHFDDATKILNGIPKAEP